MSEPILLPCPFCGGAMQFRAALWPGEGDSDGIIHVAPTYCPLGQFGDDTFDKSLIEKWNLRKRAVRSDAEIELIAQNMYETVRGRSWFGTVADREDYLRLAKAATANL